MAVSAIDVLSQNLELKMEGAELLPGGSLGFHTHETLKRSKQPTLANLPRVGPKTLANPQLTRWEKSGVQGATPLGRESGGCAPKNSNWELIAHISKPATSGIQNFGEPSANEGGKMEVEGAEHLPGGLGGCPPKKLQN